MALFFHMQSHFDWSRYCWCIEGARRLDTLHSNNASDAAESGESYGAEAFGGLAGSPAPLLLSQASAALSMNVGAGLNQLHARARERAAGAGGYLLIYQFSIYFRLAGQGGVGGRPCRQRLLVGRDPRGLLPRGGGALPRSRGFLSG